MSQIKATLTGNVTNDPEIKTTPNSQVKELNVAVNHTKKNRDSGEYEQTGDTTWVTVKLWGEKADLDFEKGDLIDVTATLVNKTFIKRDGTEGSRLETDYLESATVKHRKSTESAF